MLKILAACRLGGPFPAGGHMQVCIVLTGYYGPELNAFCITFTVPDALY